MEKINSYFTNQKSVFIIPKTYKILTIKIQKTCYKSTSQIERLLGYEQAWQHEENKK